MIYADRGEVVGCDNCDAVIRIKECEPLVITILTGASCEDVGIDEYRFHGGRFGSIDDGFSGFS